MNIDDELLILLKVKGKANISQLASALGLDRTSAQSHVDGLIEHGLVARHAPAHMPGYSLTRAGEFATNLASNPITMQRPTLAARYEQFQDLDVRVKELITREQASIIANTRISWQGLLALKRLHTNATDLLATFSDLGRRYSSYRQRLDVARIQLERGHTAYLASPFLDSYHTVWFELHEDILITLGIERRERC